MRVAFTALVAHGVDRDMTSGADLSCGDGTLLRSMRLPTSYFGDIAPGYEYQGPIEATIDQIPAVDLFICTETLEHLDDPDLVLKKVRAKAQWLVLSTPIDAWNDTNPEHYWAWSREAVEGMLAAAGFTVAVYAALDLRPAAADAYCFGIWGCL
jgi:hypothetical protein